MAIIKADHKLEAVSFLFDGAGNVRDVELTVNYRLLDDVTQAEETRVRKTRSVWASLTPTQQAAANTMGTRLKALAEAL